MKGSTITIEYHNQGKNSWNNRKGVSRSTAYCPSPLFQLEEF